MPVSKSPAAALPKAPTLRTVEVELVSGRKAKLQELNGRQQMIADSCAAGSGALPLLYYRAIGALESLDGVPMPPAAGKDTLDAIMDVVTGVELSDLVEKYADAFNAKDSENNLKNA